MCPKQMMLYPSRNSQKHFEHRLHYVWIIYKKTEENLPSVFSKTSIVEMANVSVGSPSISVQMCLSPKSENKDAVTPVVRAMRNTIFCCRHKAFIWKRVARGNSSVTITHPQTLPKLLNELLRLETYITV